jgi:hypothetical protein
LKICHSFSQRRHHAKAAKSKACQLGAIANKFIPGSRRVSGGKRHETIAQLSGGLINYFYWNLVI